MAPGGQDDGGRMIDALTGVRAVALAFVVLFHLQVDAYRLVPGSDVLKPVIGLAPLGPDLFFMLSGYVLCYRYAAEFQRRIERRDLRDYLVMRFARIYPVHLVTLHVMVALIVVARLAGVTINSAGVTRFDLTSYLQNLLVVHAWFGQNMSWNYPAWSVSVEWFAYALFPAVALVAARVGKARVAWVAALALVLAYWAVNRELYPPTGEVNLQGVLLRGSADFLAGCLVFRASALTPRAGRLWPLVPPVVVVVLLASAYVLPQEQNLMLPLLLVLLFSLARNGGVAARLLATRPVVAVGLRSYSIYMTHALVLVGSSRITDRLEGRSTAVGVVYLLGVLVVVVAAGWAMHAVVEEPLRRRIARRWIPRRPRSVPPSVPGTDDQRGAVHVPTPRPAAEVSSPAVEPR